MAASSSQNQPSRHCVAALRVGSPSAWAWLTIALLLGCGRPRATDHETSAASTRSNAAPPAPKRGFSASVDLRDGDIIFQESSSRQSEMVRSLTGSRWTHMGVIFLEPQPLVLEAASEVRFTPLEAWIHGGRGRVHVVKRLRDPALRLTQPAIARMRELAQQWLGRRYDPQFRWDDRTLYCSELVYKLFERAAGVRVGTVVRAAETNLRDRQVQQALRQRFPDGSFDPDESVVTPVSIFEDQQLVLVVSSDASSAYAPE
jgi:hypothetical protein